METVEVTSESLTIRDLNNAEDVLRCMKEAERKPEPQILFESDPRGLNLDSRCHFLRGANFDILERYFEKNGREYRVDDPQGIPYRLYSVPKQRNEIVKLLLGIHADRYYQMSMEIPEGIVNRYCAERA